MDESREAGAQGPGNTPPLDERPTAPEPAPPAEAAPVASEPVASGPIPPPPPIVPTREYRATMTFAIIAGFLLLALLIVSTSSNISGSSGGAYLAAVLGILTSGFAAWGLSNRRPWARFAMTPMLQITAVAGLVVFLIALSRGGINIPIGAMLAAWSLAAKPSAALGPLPASSTEGMLLIAGTAVAALIQFA